MFIFVYRTLLIVPIFNVFSCRIPIIITIPQLIYCYSFCFNQVIDDSLVYELLRYKIQTVNVYKCTDKINTSRTRVNKPIHLLTFTVSNFNGSVRFMTVTFLFVTDIVTI